MRLQVKHVNSYKVGDKWYHYHRITKERLPDDPESRARRALEINVTLGLAKPARVDTREGTLEHILTIYKASTDYSGLAAETRRRYDHDLV